MILVSQSKDEVQVMDPENYKTLDVKKPKDISFDSKVIKIINLGEKRFLFLEKNTIDK